jgi:poly-gamma-glutamate capsule biosynthesis protein CapA/YwtB (metallophosphatase superfamily)
MIKKRLWRGMLIIMAFLALMSCQKPSPTVITFGGDVMLARDGKPLFTQADPWGDAGAYLSEIREQNPTAFFLVNLESPLTLEQHIPPGQGYDLCADGDQVSILGMGGVDLVSLANNHKDDCGVNGVTLTREILESASIHSAGEDYRPAYFTTNGLRVAMIAVEDVSQAVDHERMRTSIQDAKENCDFVIVSVHGGNEYQAGASELQKDLAREITDAGADVIWGHHPHILQPITWLESSGGSHRTLVMYSLGNLLTDQGMNADVRESALVSITIIGGEIAGIEVFPLEMDPFGKILQHADEGGRKKIQDRLQTGLLDGVGIVVK